MVPLITLFIIILSPLSHPLISICTTIVFTLKRGPPLFFTLIEGHPYINTHTGVECPEENLNKHSFNLLYSPLPLPLLMLMMIGCQKEMRNMNRWEGAKICSMPTEGNWRS